MTEATGVTREAEALYDNKDPEELESQSLSYLAACCLARRRRTRCGGRRRLRAGMNMGDASRPGDPLDQQGSSVCPGEAPARQGAPASKVAGEVGIHMLPHCCKLLRARLTPAATHCALSTSRPPLTAKEKAAEPAASRALPRAMKGELCGGFAGEDAMLPQMVRILRRGNRRGQLDSSSPTHAVPSRDLRGFSGEEPAGAS